MSDDEFRVLRRQYFGMVIAAVVSKPGGYRDAATEDMTMWCWKSADGMARRVRLTEDAEAKVARDAAERLPLR